MSDEKKLTVAELCAKLGLAHLNAAKPEDSEKAFATFKGAIQSAMEGIAGAPIAAAHLGLDRLGYTQSSLADVARYKGASTPHSVAEHMRQSVRNAIAEQGVHVIDPNEIKISLFTHDELIAETPTDNLLWTESNSPATHTRYRWDENAATPGQILEDLNALAKNIREAAAMPLTLLMGKAPLNPIIPLKFETLEPMPHAPVVTTEARTGGVILRSHGALSYMGELVGYPHGDTGNDRVDATRYAMGHFHNLTPPVVTINCRCYADFRVIVAKTDDETGHYAAGDEVTRAPWRMPRLRLAGRPIDPRALGWLAVMHDPTPREYQNRHTANRWLRRFRPVLEVASDALRDDNRPLAIEVLAEHIGVNEAIDLTAPCTFRGTMWTGSLRDERHVGYQSTAIPFAQMIGRLHRDHPQIQQWSDAVVGEYVADDAAATLELDASIRSGDGPFRFANAAGELPAGVEPSTDYYAYPAEDIATPLMYSRGTIALDLGANPTYRPAPGDPVFVDSMGRVQRPDRVPGPPIGRFVGPGDQPGTMLVELGYLNTPAVCARGWHAAACNQDCDCEARAHERAQLSAQWTPTVQETE